jgi:hypothetical protein
LLGVSPTHAQTKGQQIIGRKTGTVSIAKSGLWQLSAADREPEDMDGQIHELISRMTSDLSVWQDIGKRFKMDLFCGLFMRESNEGFTLSPQSLLLLGQRGIKIGFDIYGRDDQRIRLESKHITDWHSFHSVFAGTLGFPDFYGRNMNAWIDCMSCVDDADAGMSRFTVPYGEIFHLEITDAEDFKRRLPEIFQAMFESATFVNHRRVEAGEPPVLSLILL